ncbi:MAG: TcpQ domain-containing protein [Pseudoxanthomonas sp.]
MSPSLRLPRWPSLVFLLLALSACGTTPAPDYKGKWKSLNRFADTPVAIPLTGSYVYQASPMDGTLKTLLTRWAGDNGMVLEYRLDSDYTLFAPVAQVATTSLPEALAQVGQAYAGQGVSLALEGGRIVVVPAPAASAP